MTTNKEFCTYEQSLALKELGFDEPCFGIYYYQEAYPMLTPNSDEKEIVFKFGQYIKQTSVTILAPLKQQVFRWFREEFGLNYEITAAGYPGEYHAFVQNYIYGNNGNSPSVFSYEEAEAACIDKLIQLIKVG